MAHIGIVDEGQPFVLPVACARDGDRLLVHGSTGSRLMRQMAQGSPVCATVTLLDGMVLARSAFNSSMHYRSAMILGVAQPTSMMTFEALRVLTDHLLPGRWEVLREPTRKELAATPGTGAATAGMVGEGQRQSTGGRARMISTIPCGPGWCRCGWSRETLCPPRTSDSISRLRSPRRKQPTRPPWHEIPAEVTFR